MVRERNMSEMYRPVIRVLNVFGEIIHIAWAAQWYTSFLCGAI